MCALLLNESFLSFGATENVILNCYWVQIETRKENKKSTGWWGLQTKKTSDPEPWEHLHGSFVQSRWGRRGWSVLWVCQGGRGTQGEASGDEVFQWEIRAINYNGEENDLMGKLQRKEALSLGGLGRKRFPIPWFLLSRPFCCSSGTRVRTEPIWFLTGLIFDRTNKIWSSPVYQLLIASCS